MVLCYVKHLLPSLCSCRKKGRMPRDNNRSWFAHCLCCFSLTNISSSHLSDPLPRVRAILVNLVSTVCIFTLNELFISKSLILFGNILACTASAEISPETMLHNPSHSKNYAWCDKAKLIPLMKISVFISSNWNVSRRVHLLHQSQFCREGRMTTTSQLVC